MRLIEVEHPRVQGLELHRSTGSRITEGAAMSRTFRSKHVFRLKIALHLKNARGRVVVGNLVLYIMSLRLIRCFSSAS